MFHSDAKFRPKRAPVSRRGGLAVKTEKCSKNLVPYSDTPPGAPDSAGARRRSGESIEAASATDLPVW